MFEPALDVIEDQPHPSSIPYLQHCLLCKYNGVIGVIEFKNCTENLSPFL